MAAPKIYVRLRIETLELHIARVQALGRPDAVRALRYLARSVGVNLDESAITKHTAMYSKELARWKADDERRRGGPHDHK